MMVALAWFTREAIPWKASPSRVMAVEMAPPAMGPKASEKLFTTPGRKTVARYWASGTRVPFQRERAALRSGSQMAAAAADIWPQAACQAAMAGA